MAKDPAFLLYYKDILVSCADMDADVLGWYTRLLCHQADKPEGLPGDMESLALLAGVKISQFERFKKCWKHTLEAKFEKNDKGMLQNPTQAKGLEARRNYKNKQEKRGIVGAFIKKNRSKNDFSNDDWKRISYDMVQKILPIDKKEEIESILKHTLEAYATSIYGNGNGNGNGNSIKDKGGVGEKGDEPKLQSVYTRCVDLYFNFFKKLNDGTPPKFDKKHGENMKSIITYLTSMVKAKQTNLKPPVLDDEVVKSFAYVLDNWEHLSEFSRQQTDICSMNSQFNRITTELKNKKKNGAHSKNAQQTGRTFTPDPL